MKRLFMIVMAVAVAEAGAWAATTSDLGERDVLRLEEVSSEKGAFQVAVQVINDQELVALDIPLRFGQPGDTITLERVEWSKRVEGWDFTLAAIDNEGKTVILGLFANVLGSRTDVNLAVSSEEDPRVATLVFAVQGGHKPALTTFTTKHPGHALTFIYNRYEAGKPHVEQFTPEFGVSSSYKQAALPESYELSQNYPNPFNATTSFVLSLPEASEYSVQIYNVTGQVVKTFAGHSEPGKIRVTWDGTNDQGGPVASGVYFYRVKAQEFSQIRRMVMLK